MGMVNTCKSMAVSFQCMTKFITNKKKEIIKKKKKDREELSSRGPLQFESNPAIFNKRHLTSVCTQ